jgi:hypothetical protein
VKKSIPEIEVKFQGKTYTSRAGLKPITRFAKWFGMRELVESHLYLPGIRWMRSGLPRTKFDRRLSARAKISPEA